MADTSTGVFLVWQMAGPLASWGRTAVGEKRLSDAEPTRSALIGLLAACLGIDRRDEDNLLALTRTLGLASAIVADPGDRRGPVMLRDYHTIQTSKPGGRRGRIPVSRAEELHDTGDTILSERYYYSGGLYLGCAWTRPSPLVSLEDLATALRSPVYTPYLGRRSCPTGLPFAPRVADAAGCEEAMVMYMDDQGPQELFGGKTTMLRLSWDLDAPGKRPHLDQQVRRRDAAVSFRRRQFIERAEGVTITQRGKQPAATIDQIQGIQVPDEEEMFDDIP